jgi:hypothetical protein
MSSNGLSGRGVVRGSQAPDSTVARPRTWAGEFVDNRRLAGTGFTSQEDKRSRAAAGSYQPLLQLSEQMIPLKQRCALHHALAGVAYGRPVVGNPE